jgi:hypothetical protein
VDDNDDDKITDVPDTSEMMEHGNVEHPFVGSSFSRDDGAKAADWRVNDEENRRVKNK